MERLLVSATGSQASLSAVLDSRAAIELGRDPERAATLEQEALASFEGADNVRGYLMAGLAGAYHRAGRLDRANEAVDEADRLARRGVARVVYLRELARFLSRADPDGALDRIEEALAIYVSNGLLRPGAELSRQRAALLR